MKSARCRETDLLDKVRQVQTDEVLELLVAEGDALTAHLRQRTDLMRTRSCTQRGVQRLAVLAP